MLSLKEFYQQKRDLFNIKRNLKSKVLKKGLKKMGQKSVAMLKNKGNQGIVYVNSSFNNTIVALTTLKGKVRSVQSAGSCGFEGKKKRSTKFAIQSTLDSIAIAAKDQNVKGIFLYLKGFSRSRHYLLKCFRSKSLKILGIRDVTPNPHNGCRPKKVRRG